jgi:hypothetical protein
VAGCSPCCFPCCTTGLTGALGDIGNWTEPLGLASLYVEAGVCALGLYALAQFRRTR